MKTNIFSGKLKVVILGLVASIVLSGILAPHAISAQAPAPTPKVVKTIVMVATAYSSTPDQTDDTPNITASNKEVRDGFVANNGLKFGTKIRMPELYGDKIFVVEDRMHKRKGVRQIDIWKPTYSAAKNFGVKWNIKVEVLES